LLENRFGMRDCADVGGWYWCLPPYPVIRWGEDAKTGGDFEYVVKGDVTAEITAYTGNENDVIIPGILDGTWLSQLETTLFTGM
jgi:hypothetical protein